ncbi:MAG: hypothetical protein ACRDQH_02145 [Pseudonocardiaceae bacterium]
MSRAHRRAVIDKRRTNAAVPVARLVPPDPPRDDGAVTVPQHPVAATADRGVLEIVGLDDRLAPVGMLPTDPAWMRLTALLSLRPRRWWNTIFGMTFLAVMVIGAAAAAVVMIGTLVPGSRWVAGASVIAGTTAGGVTVCRRRRRRRTARRSRHGKGPR